MCNADALITSDWKSLYIDKDLFEDERRQNRLRFSLAHELGHYILHQKFYSNLEINSLEDFYNYTSLANEQYGYLETQANKFAGYLLAPRDLLKMKFDAELEIFITQLKRNSQDSNNFDKALIKSYIANPLAKKFGISQQAMEIVLAEVDM